MIVCLTPGLSDDIIRFGSHPHSKYHESKVRTLYESNECSNIFSTIYSAADKLLRDDLFGEYRLSLAARSWVPGFVPVGFQFDTHRNVNPRTSDEGFWRYTYASLNKNQLYITIPFTGTAMKVQDNEDWYYDVYHMDYTSSTKIANSKDERSYKLVFPGSNSMFLDDVQYIIPTSLL